MSESDRRSRLPGLHHRGWRRRGGEQPEGAEGREEDEEGVAGRPQPCLLRQRQQGLDQDGVREQSEQAAGVPGRVEEVRVPRRCVPTRREPTLENRARSRDDEERQAGRRGERPQQAEVRVLTGACVRCDRDREHDERHEQQAELEQ